MTRTRTSANEAAPGAGIAGTAGSHALPQERTKLVAKITHSLPPESMPETAAQDRDAVIAGTIRVFRGAGVTSGDLRSWAPWCPVLGELADAMDSTPMAGAA